MVELDNQSALDGSVVWAKLKELGKTVGVGEFTAKALLHNLQESDYSRPLDEVRDLFWNAPRMPLLPGGDMDLQAAVFDAIHDGFLRLVGDDGSERVVSKPGEIGVGSASLRLAPPKAPEPVVEPTDQPAGGGGEAGGAGSGAGAAGGAGTDGGDYPTYPDVQVRVSLNTNLDDPARRHAVFKLMTEIANVVGDGDASHAQLSVGVVVPKKKSDALAARAEAAGGTSSETALE